LNGLKQRRVSRFALSRLRPSLPAWPA
jgi:hypothetical protein